jgi:hypothetical protein
MVGVTRFELATLAPHASAHFLRRLYMWRRLYQARSAVPGQNGRSRCADRERHRPVAHELYLSLIGAWWLGRSGSVPQVLVRDPSTSSCGVSKGRAHVVRPFNWTLCLKLPDFTSDGVVDRFFSTQGGCCWAGKSTADNPPRVPARRRLAHWLLGRPSWPKSDVPDQPDADWRSVACLCAWCLQMNDVRSAASVYLMAGRENDDARP